MAARRSPENPRDAPGNPEHEPDDLQYQLDSHSDDAEDQSCQAARAAQNQPSLRRSAFMVGSGAPLETTSGVGNNVECRRRGQAYAVASISHHHHMPTDCMQSMIRPSMVIVPSRWKSAIAASRSPSANSYRAA